MTDIAELSIPITADTRQIDAALERVERELQRLGRGGPASSDLIDPRAQQEAARLREALERLTTQQQRTATESQRTARETANAAAAQGRAAREALNTAAAQQRLARETSNAAAAAARAEAAQQRLARQTAETGAATRRTADGFTILPRSIAAIEGPALAALQSIGGALAGAFAVEQIAAFSAQAIQSANQLEDVKESLSTIAGSTELYNEALRAAEQSQQLFGGSLAENISDVQAFVLSSRTAGVALDDLLLVSRQLATLDPAQGLKGANVALREFLSGNITSLAQRFELPRTVLRELGDETSTTADKLNALSSFLADAGITAEAISGRLDNTSQSFRDLQAAADNAQTSIGAILAQLAAPGADALAQSLTGLSLLLDRLNGSGNAFTEQAAAAAASATDYEAYRASIDANNAAIDAFIARNQQTLAVVNQISPGLGQLVAATLDLTARTDALSKTQFDYAAALRARGVAETEADAQARANAGALTFLETAYGNAGGALDAYKGQIATLAAANEGNLQAVTNLITLFDLEQISAEQLAAGLNGLEEATRNGEAAARARAEAEKGVADELFRQVPVVDEATRAAGDAAAKRIEQAQEAERAKQAEEDLERAIAQAASRTGDVGAAVDFIVNKYGLEVDRVYELIGAYRQLDAARNQKPPKGFGGTAPRDVAVAEAATRTASERRQIEREITEATADTAGRLALVNQDLKRGNLSFEERKRLLVDQARLQQQLARENARGSGGRLTDEQRAAQTRERAQESLAEKLLSINEGYYEQATAAEEAYQQDVLAIVRRYAEQQAAAERDLAASSTRGRANFYKGLTGSDLPQEIQQNLSAAYEQAFAEAQRLSQEGQAALAADYLALKQEQIQAEQAFQEEVAKLQAKASDKTAPKGERDQARADIDRLNRLRELEKAAEAVELDNLQRGGDANVTQRDAALTDAQAERQAALAEAAAKVGDATEAAQQKALNKTTEQNKALAEQLRLAQEIARLGGVPLPESAPAAPTAPAQPAAPPPPPTAPTAPPAPPVAPAAALSSPEVLAALVEIRAGLADVRAGLDLLLPEAQRTANATEPLAGKLGEVVGAVDRVRGAVGDLGSRGPFGTE